MTVDSTIVYRDATYSAETQDELRRLKTWLWLRGMNGNDSRMHALADVIDRWDANEATETTFS